MSSVKQNAKGEWVADTSPPTAKEQEALDRITHKQIAKRCEIIRIVNGSKLYGLNHNASDDDQIAVFVEPSDIVFSGNKIETALLHDRKPEDKSAEGEIDGVSYSVRHFLKLALGGNPSIVTLLFAPEQFWLGQTWEMRQRGLARSLMDLAEDCVSMQAAPRFKGYMQNQLERLKGIKTGHTPNRPELVEEFGYDTKYAMSVARLAIQGTEYFDTGRIESPMAPFWVDYLKDIRFGKFTYVQIIPMLESLEETMLLAISESELPTQPNYAKVYARSRSIHELHWSNQ